MNTDKINQMASVKKKKKKKPVGSDKFDFFLRFSNSSLFSAFWLRFSL